MLGECVPAPLHQGRIKMTFGLSHVALERRRDRRSQECV